MKKVFIDGSAGTTGLRIRERLSQRGDLELIILPEEIRKDVSARRDALNASDVAFLCLPDAAAREAVTLVENDRTVVIDTSTAHRCNPAWTYGFAELAGQRARIAAAKRIANPGCHASGFIALVAPLVRAGLIAPETVLSAFSLTGYSGGGKKMIADYDEKLGGTAGATAYWGGRHYALGQAHKHLPEMALYGGLVHAPVFSPIVVPHLSGMEVTVALDARSLRTVGAAGAVATVRQCLAESYPAAVGARTALVRFAEDVSDGGFISSAALSGRDDMVVSAYGNDERIVLVSVFDNLGKGASGAAIQNMNIALGVEESTGLVVS